MSLRPLNDVWLKFDQPDDETPSLEANTFKAADGYQIRWYHVDAGVVNRVNAPTLGDVFEWYASHGFTDYTA